MAFTPPLLIGASAHRGADKEAEPSPQRDVDHSQNRRRLTLVVQGRFQWRNEK
jgi:hypothetical protein